MARRFRLICRPDGRILQSDGRISVEKPPDQIASFGKYDPC